MRVAAVDCGTNTIKLLVAETDGAGGLRELERESRIVRLGQDVDRTGRLAPDAVRRAFDALDGYADLVRRHHVDRIRFCATSATRDASNGEEFAAGVRERLGVGPDVLAGEEEARLAFSGAVGNLATPPQPPVLVVDIGGGSTELILGTDAPAQEHSMDIGAVRLHERLLHDDPPTVSQVAAARGVVDAHLDACPVDPTVAATVVGVAGTILTVAAGVLGLDAYDPRRTDQAVLPVTEVHAQAERLLAMTVAERRALPHMEAGRADVIGAGALILDRILRRAGADRLLVSEADILDGIARSLVDPR